MHDPDDIPEQDTEVEDAPMVKPEPVQVEIRTLLDETVVTLKTGPWDLEGKTVRCPAGDTQRILEALIGLARGKLHQERRSQ